jgi:hypothetical protein
MTTFVKGYTPWNKGKKCSYISENNRRMKGRFSESRIKKLKETQRMVGVGKWMKGRHLSQETKEKLSFALKGKKKPPFTEKHRIRIGIASKGRNFTEETRKKMGDIIREQYRLGIRKPHRENGFKPLEKHWNWKGGKSFEPYSIDWTRTLRQSIRERDSYTCQLCGDKQGDYAFSVHHIDYNKNNCNSDNLITLCKKCHTKTNYNRNYWLNYLKNYV